VHADDGRAPRPRRRDGAATARGRDVTTRGHARYRLRPANADDAAAIARIYNQGIEDRLATLETELRTPEERRQWLAGHGPRHPVIVAESVEAPGASSRPAAIHAEPEAPTITVGWGSLNVFNARPAYRFVADFSVYVDRAWRGQGVGRVLLERLIELGREHGFHKLVLSAFPTNSGGMALYSKLGFRTVGIYREQGQLDGRWVDTILMERLL
jgi:L-amino acid N-acyltransferase YncA